LNDFSKQDFSNIDLQGSNFSTLEDLQNSISNAQSAINSEGLDYDTES
jgi:hypothetical protein